MSYIWSTLEIRTVVNNIIQKREYVNFYQVNKCKSTLNYLVIFNFQINVKFTFGQMKETRKYSLRFHHPDFIKTEAKMMNK